MEAVHAVRPLCGGMFQQGRTVLLHIRRQLDAQWILNVRRLQHRRQQRGSREIRDCESMADEILAALQLLLDPI